MPRRTPRTVASRTSGATRSRPHVPPGHPRAESLRIRSLLVNGTHRGLVVPQGLLAHGRGEAFDYLLGECTHRPARLAIVRAAQVLCAARHPVVSVNGNLAALVPDDLVRLARAVPAVLEVNLFYRSASRITRIRRHLLARGAGAVLGRRADGRIPVLTSPRRFVERRGIGSADVVLVGLEDGDRTEALRRAGVIVIAVDVNPLSRTARMSHVTIVDNAVRVYPLLVKEVRRIRSARQSDDVRPRLLVKRWKNRGNLRAMERIIRRSVIRR